MSEWQYMGKGGGNPFGDTSMTPIPTMKRMERSGTTDELGPLMGGIAAMGVSGIFGAAGALANPLLGRGVSGAIGTAAGTPSESEGGLLLQVGKRQKHSLLGKAFQKILGKPDVGDLRQGNNWLMGNRIMHEVTTNTPSMKASRFDVGDTPLRFNGYDDTLRTSMDDLIKKGLSPEEAKLAKNQLLEVQNTTPRVVSSEHNNYLAENKSTFGTHSSDGTINIRGFKPGEMGHNGNVIDDGDVLHKFMKDGYENIAVHEGQHGVQSSPYSDMNKYISKGEYSRKTKYKERIHEAEARIAGNRGQYNESLVDAGHKYGVHPFLTHYGRGKFGIDNGLAYIKSAIKAGEMTKKEASSIMNQLKQESNRLSELYRVDKEFQKQFSNINPFTYFQQ